MSQNKHCIMTGFDFVKRIGSLVWHGSVMK
jgi:hypothetical protein